MIWLTLNLHLVAWLYDHGHYAQAVHELHYMLHAERDHPYMTSLIHRFMYALNPDWGL